MQTKNPALKDRKTRCASRGNTAVSLSFTDRPEACGTSANPLRELLML